MTRVLQVISDTDRRGAQVFALDLQAALVTRGPEVRTVALAPGRSPGVDVPVLGRAPLGPASLIALRRTAQRFDAVLAHGSTTLPASALALAGTRVPFAYRNIGDPLHWANTVTKRWRVRRFLSRAAAVAALWPASAAMLTERLGVARARVRVIPNGVPQERYVPATAEHRAQARRALGVDGDGPVVLYVGALVPEKDVCMAIAAVADDPDWRLLVVGDGPLRHGLERHAARQAPGRVVFTGSLTEPAPAYAAADVIVLPSRSEGLPAVLIEAALAAVPAVATDVGGVGEIVRPDTGVRVAVGDLDGLRAGIRRVLERHDELASAARRHCLAHFEIGVVAKQWAGLLDEVVQKPVHSD